MGVPAARPDRADHSGQGSEPELRAHLRIPPSMEIIGKPRIDKHRLEDLDLVSLQHRTDCPEQLSGIGDCEPSHGVD